MKIKNTEIEDTYCEAFDGLYLRLLVTAKDEKRLKRAAYDSTALPCTVLGESEGGVEKFTSETPDNRPGAIVQIWVNYSKDAAERLEYEMGKRIRQGILVVPTTAVFNALESENEIGTMYRIGNCGDGYEFVEDYLGRQMINVPVMMGSFRIEKGLGYKKGIMGGNIWFMCTDEDVGLDVLDRAEKSLGSVEGVVASFREGCSAGSKAGGKFEHIGPTTNHWYCPTLKEQVESKVPEGVTSIPEIVLNGPDVETVAEAMKAVIGDVAGTDGLVRISTGNYGGKLGRHKIFLRDIL